MPSDLTSLQRASALAAQRSRELGVVTPELFERLTDRTMLPEDMAQAALVREQLRQGGKPTPEQITDVEKLVEAAGVSKSPWWQRHGVSDDRQPLVRDWLARTVLRVTRKG